MTIRVGTLAVATRDSGVCKAGEYGVCYEIYTLEDRPGYSFIFERGGFDGFSPYDVETFLEVFDLVAASVTSYTFTNISRLVQDYRVGRFGGARDANNVGVGL